MSIETNGQVAEMLVAQDVPTKDNRERVLMPMSEEVGPLIMTVQRVGLALPWAMMGLGAAADVPTLAQAGWLTAIAMFPQYIDRKTLFG